MSSAPENDEGEVFLFQYGSNMDPDRLRGRLKAGAQELGIARLDGWGILFDIYSKKNRCGATDIVEAPENVLGVLYRVRRDLVVAPTGQRSRMDEIEGAGLDEGSNYQRIQIDVQIQGAKVRAYTYVGTEPGRDRYLRRSSAEQLVSRAYFQHLLKGAERFHFPAEYVAYLESKAHTLKEQVSTSVVSHLSDWARVDPTHECCGLLAGRDGVVTHAFPAENVAADPTKNYEMAPKEIVRLMREFRASGLTFLGIYHSHPNGENAPSARDIERAYYSEEAYFIVSPQPDAPKPVRAFSICDGLSTELEIQIV